jgi:hypothetical protein
MPSGKPKLLLHVGSHKTGTTSIQDALAANRTWLEQNGVYYPNPKPFFFRKTDAHHDLAHALAGGSDRQLTGARRFRAHLLEASSQHNRILLSAEPFYRHVVSPTNNDRDIAAEVDGETLTEDDLLRRRRKYVARVAEYFEDFDVEIILFLRRPDNFAESLYKNAVVSTQYKGGFRKYTKRKTFKFDYRTQRLIFAKHFPLITIRSYEGSMAKGIVPAFFETIGLDGPPPAASGAMDRLRRSLSNKATLWIDRSKLELELSRQDVYRRWHFSMLPTSTFASESSSTLWTSSAERDAFLDRYMDPDLEELFPRNEDHALDRASLSDDEHASASAKFLEWEQQNGSYLAWRERRRIPPYRLDKPAPALDVAFTAVKPVASEGKTVAAICCITRHRPRMLSALLASWSKLELPETIDPVFIVVENDELAPNEKIVAKARPGFTAGRLIYMVEPEIGIPQARNAAIQVALDHGAGFVAFVDDDETVSADWFVRLHQTYVLSGAQLIGGPVRAAVVSQPAGGVYLRIIQNGIRDRYRHVEQKAAVRLRRGQLDRITILTNNWLAHADLFIKHGLRFDPELRYSGGSDTQFFRDAVEKGIRTGWAPDAVVFETVPPERTSLAYQYRRGREQSKTSVRAKIKAEGHAKILPVLIMSIALRSIGAGLLFVAIPLTGGRTLVRFTRSCGWIVGRVAGYFGGTSLLYRQITGN